MKKILFALSLVALLVSCGETATKQPKVKSKGFEVKELNVDSPDCDQYVLMSTSHGDIKIKLYRDAPMHRKNFINLGKTHTCVVTVFNRFYHCFRHHKL
jgi:hypothetical protein